MPFNRMLYGNKTGTFLKDKKDKSFITNYLSFYLVPGAAFGRGVRSHLQGVVSVRGWFRIGPRSENAARGSLRGMIHTIEIFTNKI